MLSSIIISTDMTDHLHLTSLHLLKNEIIGKYPPPNNSNAQLIYDNDNRSKSCSRRIIKCTGCNNFTVLVLI